MKTIQKVGGFASLAFGLTFMALIGLLITIASQGYVPGSGDNPSKALEFAANSSVPYIIYLLYALLAILIVLIVITLSERWKDHQPVKMRLATISAGGTGVLFLIYAMLGYVGEPILITFYRQDASMGAAAYMAMRIVSNALNSGAIFAAGWSILLTGWAAFREVDFPKALAVLLLVAGGSSVLAFAIPILSLLSPLLYIVWSIWLGVFLLRSSFLSAQVPNLIQLRSEN